MRVAGSVVAALSVSLAVAVVYGGPALDSQPWDQLSVNFLGYEARGIEAGVESAIWRSRVLSRSVYRRRVMIGLMKGVCVCGGRVARL